jgi:hypothetical protein
MVGGLAGFFTAFLAVLVLERFAEPRHPERPILHRVSLLAAMPLILFYLSVFMVTYRPIFATLFTIIVFLGIVVVNNAKVRELNEPLVYSDFALLRQAIEHPGLYVTYIGPFKVAAVILSGGASILACLVFEPPVVVRDTAAEWIATLAYFLVFFGAIYAITRGPLRNEFRQILKRFGASTDIREDVDKLSLVISLIFYFFLAGEQDEAVAVSERNEREDRTRMLQDGTSRPAVVVVQSESFFDARNIMTKVPEGFLAEFDRTAGNARYAGRLRVPAWGANTLRTEFAFLSGIPDEALGVDRFNPYLKYCNKPVWTVASYFRSVGYRTVCIHPFHKSFFRRNRVYPHLGFDEFIDIQEFNESDKLGTYVSDAAVTRKIEEKLAESERPLFIFAITMENHGPWRPKRIDIPEAVLDATPRRARNVAQYLAHLENADAMIGRLRRVLKKQASGAVFCFYGDHLPGFSKFFNAIGMNDPRTDYFIWHTGPVDMKRRANVSADAVNRMILEAFVAVTSKGEEKTDERDLRRQEAGRNI